MLKLSLLTTCLLCFCLSTFAQIKKDFSASGVKTLHIVIDDCDLIIEGGNSSQISLETENLPAIPERAKGLKALYNNASDNTGAGMEMTKDGSIMHLVKARSHSGTYKIKVPSGMNIKIEDTNWTGGDFKISKVSGEIEVASKNSDVYLDQVSGPITASSTSGDIEVIFNKLTQSKPTYISNISGVIDVKLGASEKANVVLRTVTGEIYSNYDLVKSKDGMKNYGNRTIELPLNGGGAELKLKNIAGEIYLRK
ncbi:MAG: hypothetical protein Sapg2KO_50460 [Saprospiraceae bacterium]|mgnify:CR=1 FL=1